MTRPASAALGPLLALAARLLQAGRPADAVAPLRQAALLAPGNAPILHDLGLACLECGLLGDAVAALRAAVAANPRFADAHLRLGIALERAGEFDAALAAYRAASDALPSLADARFRAGELLESLGQTGRAAQAFRRAAASAPKTTLGRIAAARALLAENRDAEAVKTLRQALALDKTNAAALELLGNTLADAGRFEEARDLLCRAVACDPSRAGSYYDVVRCRRMGSDDAPLIERIRAAADWPGLQPAQRSRVHLALGKAADDLGDPQSAMRHFDAAEAWRNQAAPFDAGSFLARVERMAARFPASAPADGGDPTPILVLGLPRSGTTLVEQILCTHPDVAGGGELPFWGERGLAWEQAGAPGPDAAFLAGLAADYLGVLRTIDPRAPRVTDKMPLNFQWAGLINAALPGATIVHCRRSPIDTALSIHQTHFNVRMAFPTGGEALVVYMRAYERLMAHWRGVLPPARLIEVDYERLTEDPRTVIAWLLEACGLPWNDACLHPERNARPVKTPSKFQARQPITGASVGRWKAYEPWLGPLRALLD